MRLAHDAQVTLDRRRNIGEICLCAVDGTGVQLHGEDREVAASDAIADILTAVFGPFGVTTPDGVRPSMEALLAATELLERAMRSYEADAEDYYTEDGVEDEQC